MLPGLTVGICEDSLAAKAFAESNMRVVIVGSARVEAKDVVRRASWSELAEKGS
jgi:3-keto-L-gulonate-6-phosphate decarboxylase